MKEKMRPRSPTQREHFEFLSILLNLFLDLHLIVVVVMMVPSPASRREAETILYDSLGCLCLYFYLAFLIIFLMKEFFLKDEASGTGRKKLELRENRLRLCAFNPFPQTPEQGENILRFGSCVIVGRVLNFFPSNSSFLFFSVSPSLLTVKTRGEGKQFCWVGKKYSRDFRNREKEGRTRKNIFMFYSTQERRNSRKGKTFESSRRPRREFVVK